MGSILAIEERKSRADTVQVESWLNCTNVWAIDRTNFVYRHLPRVACVRKITVIGLSLRPLPCWLLGLLRWQSSHTLSHVKNHRSKPVMLSHASQVECINRLWFAHARNHYKIRMGHGPSLTNSLHVTTDHSGGDGPCNRELQPFRNMSSFGT